MFQLRFFPFRRLGCAVIATLLMTAGIAAEEIIRLSNAEVEIEIAPRLGGRITSFRRRGGKNVLFSVADAGRENAVPSLHYRREFRQYYGHVMWLGPQSAWWQQQEAEPVPREKGWNWPPDPYWEFSRFAVIFPMEDRVLLISGHSPFSGVTMTKEVRLRRNGVELRTAIVNTGKRRVSWGLWSNTRVCADAVVCVPADPEQPLKYEFKTWDILNEKMLTGEIVNGYFVFRTPGREAGDNRIYKGKSFLVPARPEIIARIGKCIFVKRTHPVSPSEIAPGHCPTEIYAELGGTGRKSFWELEFHGEYRTLDPGDALTFSEYWALHPEEPADIAEKTRQEKREADTRIRTE